jgi:hypothetical protein
MHAPGYTAATTLMSEEVAGRRLFLIAPDNIRHRVLAQLAEDFAGDRLAELIALSLYLDVSSVLLRLHSEGLLALVPTDGMVERAFLVSLECGIPLDDAIYCALAIVNQEELLIADPVLTPKVDEVARAYPDLRYRDLCG